MELLLYITEMVGIVVFAISGAMVAIKCCLDVFGVAVLGVVTAAGGGLVRDLILGELPPRIFHNYNYVLLALIVALLTFVVIFSTRKVIQTKNTVVLVVNTLDSIGLALFTVMGCGYAVEAGHGDNGFLVVFLGLMTGVGGGIMRDVLVAHVPSIFRKHIYALASIAGGVVYFLIFHYLNNRALAMGLGMGITIAIRVAAAHYKWNLPCVPNQNQQSK